MASPDDYTNIPASLTRLTLIKNNISRFHLEFLGHVKGLTHLILDSPLTGFVVGAHIPNNLIRLSLDGLQMERLDLTGYDIRVKAHSYAYLP